MSPDFTGQDDRRRGRQRKSPRVNGFVGPRLTKGAEDDVSLCMLLDSESDG